MKREPIPDEVQRFILVSIPSVPFVEALLLLRGEHTRPWDARRLSQRLYMPEKAAEALLDELHAAALLVPAADQPSSFCYKPVSDELRTLVDRLAETYSKNLVDVTNLIHSKLNKKAHMFADAFIWRKGS